MITPYYSYIASRIATTKARADSLAAHVNHHGIEGEIREIAARECIEPFLTQSFQCGTGKVIDSSGNTSDQIDLIIHHKKNIPPILVNRDLGLYPVECVRYVFEVKSTITAKEIRDSNKKFTSISNLHSFRYTKPDGTENRGRLPTTVLFAFSSDITGHELTRYISHTGTNSMPATAIVVLGKGYWIYSHRHKSWYGRDTSGRAEDYNEFCLFITGLVNTLSSEESSIIPFTPGGYILDEIEKTEAHPLADFKGTTAL